MPRSITFANDIAPNSTAKYIARVHKKLEFGKTHLGRDPDWYNFDEQFELTPNASNRIEFPIGDFVPVKFETVVMIASISNSDIYFFYKHDSSILPNPLDNFGGVGQTVTFKVVGTNIIKTATITKSVPEGPASSIYFVLSPYFTEPSFYYLSFEINNGVNVNAFFGVSAPKTIIYTSLPDVQDLYTLPDDTNIPKYLYDRVEIRMTDDYGSFSEQGRVWIKDTDPSTKKRPSTPKLITPSYKAYMDKNYLAPRPNNDPLKYRVGFYWDINATVPPPPTSRTTLRILQVKPNLPAPFTTGDTVTIAFNSTIVTRTILPTPRKQNKKITIKGQKYAYTQKEVPLVDISAVRSDYTSDGDSYYYIGIISHSPLPPPTLSQQMYLKEPPDFDIGQGLAITDNRNYPVMINEVTDIKRRKIDNAKAPNNPTHRVQVELKNPMQEVALEADTKVFMQGQVIINKRAGSSTPSNSYLTLFFKKTAGMSLRLPRLVDMVDDKIKIFYDGKIDDFVVTTGAEPPDITNFAATKDDGTLCYLLEMGQIFDYNTLLIADTREAHEINLLVNAYIFISTSTQGVYKQSTIEKIDKTKYKNGREILNLFVIKLDETKGYLTPTTDGLIKNRVGVNAFAKIPRNDVIIDGQTYGKGSFYSFTSSLHTAGSIFYQSSSVTVPTDVKTEGSVLWYNTSNTKMLIAVKGRNSSKPPISNGQKIIIREVGATSNEFTLTIKRYQYVVRTSGTLSGYPNLISRSGWARFIYILESQPAGIKKTYYWVNIKNDGSFQNVPEGGKFVTSTTLDFPPPAIHYSQTITEGTDITERAVLDVQVEFTLRRGYKVPLEYPLTVSGVNDNVFSYGKYI